MKVFTTKYALTTGIAEEEVRVSDVDDKYVYSGTIGSFSSIQYVMGRTAFMTRAEAVANVRKQIAAKRKSIVKQIKKLDELEKSL